MQLIAGFAMFVLCISILTTTANATASWEDNFDDLDDWTTFAYTSSPIPVKIEGNFSAADHTLKVLDDDANFARHDSTVNVGTWSFDMFVPDIGNVAAAMYVYIMSNGSRAIPAYPSDFIAVGAWKQSSGSSLQFIVWTMKGFAWTIHSQFSKNPMQGWHHIDVNRTSDGHFYVYFNGTLEDDFTHNDVTSSTYLEFYCYRATGAAIDNLVVEETSSILDGPTILVAVVVVVVIVLAIVFLRRR